MHHSPSMSVQQNWESFKISPENVTKRHVQVMRIRLNGWSNIPLSTAMRAVKAEKKQKWKVFTENKTKETRECMPDGETKYEEWSVISFLTMNNQFQNAWKLNWKKSGIVFNKTIKSTGAIPALKLSDGTFATKDNYQDDFLNNVFISVFTKETPWDWNNVK